MIRMDFTSTARKTEASLFLGEPEALAWLERRFHVATPAQFLLESQAIPTYDLNGRSVVLRQDLLRFERHQANGQNEGLGQIPGLRLEAMPIGDGVFLEVPRDSEVNNGASASAFAPAIANLAAADVWNRGSAPLEPQPYLCGTRIWSGSSEWESVLNAQRQRLANADALGEAVIARGTNYFGTKRRLAAFLVEAIYGCSSDNTAILDLMTGSGAAAAALSQHWQTWASDAQTFSAILARVQGAGFSKSRASVVLKTVMREAESNAASLNSQLEPFVEKEASIFTMRSNDEAREAYAELVDSFPTLGNQAVDDTWDPRTEVERRRRHPDLSPYCLFLSYFANAYFGIRQAIEIDSIRFGISQLARSDDQTWALGALIAAVSDLNTGFGGHFAQPRSHPSDLGQRQLLDLLSRRRLSVSDEFNIRLLLLGSESEQREREIAVLPGPWQAALSAFADIAAGRPGLVYFDPPYRREEYSRYYHALETLISYGYPSVTGSGLTPNKKLGERFSSEFFSRSSEKLIDVLTEIIREIASRGWTCCWSYSNQAAVPPAEVLARLSAEANVDIHSFGAPHQHRGHGRKARPRPVIEYLMVIRPRI